MTTEQALEILKVMLEEKKASVSTDTSNADALDMAIQALEQQPLIDKFKEMDDREKIARLLAMALETQPQDLMETHRFIDGTVIKTYVRKQALKAGSNWTECHATQSQNQSLTNGDRAISLNAILEFLGDTNMDIFTDEVKEFVLQLPSVTPKTGHWIHIDDVMSVFDDFMCGEVDEEGTDTFLEMLKDKAEPKVGRCEDCKCFRKLPLRTDTSIGKCIQHWGVCPPCDWYCADFEPQESEDKG